MKRLIAVYGIGYMIAVIVAVFTTEILYFSPAIFPEDRMRGPLFREMGELAGIFLIGFVYTAVTALPGYCVTVWIAARKNWHGWLYYCGSGAATAVLAHLLLATMLRGVNLELYLVLACSVPGGMTGAFCFYLWRKRILSAEST